MPKNTVITYGSFDLFHQGHYNLLKRAKALGDYLIVGITTEQYDFLRGKLNVMDSLLTRIDNVRKTGFADEIIIEDHEGQKVEDIQKYNVDIFTVGSDWEGRFDYLKPYCKVIYLERTKDISGTILRETRFPIIRIGIIGSGRIADTFVYESRFVSGINVKSVYNPNLVKAEAFAKKHDLKLSTDNLSQLFEAIDAIYVASPNITHYDYIISALEANKHVLCEKPMVLAGSQAKKAFELANEKNLVLMEAIKTAYAPGFIKLITMISAGKIGTVCDVNACLTSLTLGNIRKYDSEYFDGSLTELSSYPLFAIFKILGTNYKDVSFKSFVDKQGIDMYTEISISFENTIATAKVGLGVKTEGELIIAGTDGYLRVEAPWWKPQSFSLCSENPNQNEQFFEKYIDAGLRYEISAFINIIRSNKHDYGLTEIESIKIAEIIEKYINRENVTIFDYKTIR